MHSPCLPQPWVANQQCRLSRLNEIQGEHQWRHSGARRQGQATVFLKSWNSERLDFGLLAGKSLEKRVPELCPDTCVPTSTRESV